VNLLPHTVKEVNFMHIVCFMHKASMLCHYTSPGVTKIVINHTRTKFTLAQKHLHLRVMFTIYLGLEQMEYAALQCQHFPTLTK